MFGALYQSLSGFLDSAAFATIVFAPAKLPLDVGIQHALLGWALCQFMFSSLTEAKASLLTPTSYEAMPFLARFALLVSRDAAPASALATVLVGSVLVNLVSAALLYCLSWAPLGNVNSLLPPALQAGLFAAIGWGLYSLSFETVGLPGDASFLLSPAVLAWPAARLWIPAHVFGVGLWLASRRVSHPALFPAFVLAVCALTHCARLYTGTSLAEAQAQRWLMPHTAGRPCTTLWASMNPGAIRLDLLVRADAAKELLMAAIFGPVVNSLLNLVLIAPVIGQKLAPAPELRAQAAGLFAAGLGGGYASYIAVSNTAIFLKVCNHIRNHIQNPSIRNITNHTRAHTATTFKVGAKGRASCYAAAAAALLLFLVHPAFAIVGWVPTLLPAAICVYIGVDFLYDNLVVSASAADTLRTHTLPVAHTCRPDRRGSGEVGEVGSSRRELSS